MGTGVFHIHPVPKSMCVYRSQMCYGGQAAMSFHVNMQQRAHHEVHCGAHYEVYQLSISHRYRRVGDMTCMHFPGLFEQIDLVGRLYLLTVS